MALSTISIIRSAATCPSRTACKHLLGLDLGLPLAISRDSLQPIRPGAVAQSETLVFERELRRFRDLVRVGDYDVTKHAFEEMNADGLSMLDLEACVLEGTVVERQLDRLTGERKFIIAGRASDGLALTVVARRSAPGRMTILTSYRS